MDTIDTAKLDEEIHAKMHFTGKIIKSTLAGVVVDIGQNLPGVVHISQLQKDPINRVEDVVQVGQEVEVWVRRVRKDSIELTMIQPLALEWREIKPDMVVKGKVTRLESYGVFVDIGTERPGLLHISEISHSYVKTPNEVLHEGDEVEVKVLEVNRRKKQIRLSIKAILPKPEEKPVEVKAPTRQERPRRERKKKPEMPPVEAKPTEPEPTTMEIAWQEALARAENKNSTKNKKSENKGNDQEDILNRTLEHRLPTG